MRARALTSVSAPTAILILAAGSVACGSETCSISADDKYVAQVVEVSVGGPDNTHRQPGGAEGKPNCEESPESFISLGGGYIVFDIGCQYVTKPGPDFFIAEVAGECGGISESYLVSVSLDGATYGAAQEGFGTQTFDISGVESFRYVKVQDALTGTGSDSPGADIDGLVLLHESP